jgi:hypothetical protein
MTDEQASRLDDAGRLTPASLVGSFVHRNVGTDDDGGVWQGAVVAEPAPGIYLIEWFSWIAGDSTHQTLVPITDMTGPGWRIYDTAEWMRNAYEPIRRREEGQ